MERYTHLQTLPNSPLTPLTPLCENTAFDFNFGGDGSLDVYIDNVRHKYRMEQQQKSAPDQNEPRRYSEKFLKLRDVFEPQSVKKLKSSQQQDKNFDVHPCKLQLQDVPKKFRDNSSQEENRLPFEHHKDCEILRQQQMQIQQQQQQQLQLQQQQRQTQHICQPKTAIKITHSAATPPSFHNDYIATPKNGHTPLKIRNCNVPPSRIQKHNHQIQQQIQKHKQQQYRAFLQAHMGTPSNRPTKQNQNFLQSSPVALKPLCPRVSKILHHCGLTMYCGLFQKQEIDMFSFKILERHDLLQMGITNPKHCDIILNESYYARQYC